MTNKNMNWKSEKNPSIARPFLLKPAGKDYLWGGRRLKDDYSKETDLVPLAETWECSTHPDGPSLAASGEFAGMTLNEVLKLHPEYLGTHPRTEGEIPILIKLIDARQDLSVQVHPDDDYARKHENGSMGKTEMWYVLDAARDSSLVYGFRRDMDRDLLKKSLLEGTVEKYLQKVPIQKDDIFYIEAGIVHAIGAGTVIAEIQENSNLTYRLYDYHRVDKNGKERELHIDKALQVVNLKGSDRPRQPMRVLKYKKGCASELLCRCKYFQVERMLINTERCREMADYRTDSNSFQALLCVDGCGTLFGEDVMIHFFKGDCIFVPADSIGLKLHGRAQLLKVGC